MIRAPSYPEYKLNRDEQVPSRVRGINSPDEQGAILHFPLGV